MRDFCRWHDAGTYDASTKTGGPNGSIRNEEEYTHGSNSGLKKAIDFCGMFSLNLKNRNNFPQHHVKLDIIHLEFVSYYSKLLANGMWFCDCCG